MDAFITFGLPILICGATMLYVIKQSRNSGGAVSTKQHVLLGIRRARRFLGINDVQRATEILIETEALAEQL